VSTTADLSDKQTPCGGHKKKVGGLLGLLFFKFLANVIDGQNTAYFRGRKLHGQTVKLPADYRGVVGVRRDSPREQARANNTSAPGEVVDVDATAAEQEAQRQRLDTGRLAVLAEFDELVVWGHQSTADATTDPYVRSMDEWVALSDKVGSPSFRIYDGLPVPC
jgi:hypothetical protein